MSDNVEIVGLMEKPRTVVVTGVEMFHKLLDKAEAGDNIGALLRGVQRTEIERCQVLAKPGSIKAHTHFFSEVYVPDQGRRRPSYALLQRLSPAVLFPDDGRDRLHQDARRC